MNSGSQSVWWVVSVLHMSVVCSARIKIEMTLLANALQMNAERESETERKINQNDTQRSAHIYICAWEDSPMD